MSAPPRRRLVLKGFAGLAALVGLVALLLVGPLTVMASGAVDLKPHSLWNCSLDPSRIMLLPDQPPQAMVHTGTPPRSSNPSIQPLAKA